MKSKSKTDKNQTSKIKVALIGENRKNDAESLQTLLNSVVNAHVQFKIYPKKFEGGQLDGEKFFRTLEVEALSFDWLIFIRDLDGLISDYKKLKEKDEWFAKANKKVSKKGIFFLAIYELEALILADMESLNTYYSMNEKPIGNPMSKSEPKEILESKTASTKKGKYKESDALSIFENLKFKTVYKNHKGERSFQSFANDLFKKEIITIDKNILENHPLSKK